MESFDLFKKLRSDWETFFNREENSDFYYDLIKKIMQTTIGFDISLYRDRYIKGRIFHRIRLIGVPSFKEYHSYLQKYPIEHEKLKELLTIHTTEFFRDITPFRYLEKVILPNIAKNKSNPNIPIRILSAPCSTGQEVYSVAIIAHYLSKNHLIKNPIEIIGLEIDKKSLEKAKSGIYRKEEIKNISSASFQENFEALGNNEFQIKPFLKAYCRWILHDLFNPLNLKEQFDLVLCRNFLIYISANEQFQIINNLKRNFKKDTYLMLGITEGFQLMNVSDFRVENLEEHFYQYQLHGKQQPITTITSKTKAHRRTTPKIDSNSFEKEIVFDSLVEPNISKEPMVNDFVILRSETQELKDEIHGSKPKQTEMQLDHTKKKEAESETKIKEMPLEVKVQASQPTKPYAGQKNYLIKDVSRIEQHDPNSIPLKKSTKKKTKRNNQSNNEQKNMINVEEIRHNSKKLDHSPKALEIIQTRTKEENDSISKIVEKAKNLKKTITSSQTQQEEQNLIPQTQKRKNPQNLIDKLLAEEQEKININTLEFEQFIEFASEDENRSNIKQKTRSIKNQPETISAIKNPNKNPFKKINVDNFIQKKAVEEANDFERMIQKAKLSKMELPKPSNQSLNISPQDRYIEFIELKAEEKTRELSKNLKNARLSEGEQSAFLNEILLDNYISEEIQKTDKAIDLIYAQKAEEEEEIEQIIKKVKKSPK